MNTKLKLLLLLFLICQYSLFAQEKMLKKGDKAFDKGNYSEAILNYKAVKKKNCLVNRKIANTYFILGDYNQSEKYFSTILDEDKCPNDLIQLSQILLDRDNYEAAILMLRVAEEKGANPSDVQTRMREIDALIEFRKGNTTLKLSPISMQPKGKSLGISDFGDGIVFSDLMSTKNNSSKKHQLIKISFVGNDFKSPNAIAEKLEPETTVGGACLSPDDNTMYYTRWFTRKGKQQMEIAFARKEKGDWIPKESIGFSSRKYSCCYPFLSADGSVMYFSSDMSGGFGGMDLYVSTKIGDNWSEPKNLGNVVNTAKNEIYPSLVDNQLWFSSDGRGGYGKLDLFFTSKNEDGSWAIVKNPGKPYNSLFSDYSMLEMRGVDMKLLISDREDKGLRDKIYSLEQLASDPVNTYFEKNSLKDELVIKNIDEAVVEKVYSFASDLKSIPYPNQKICFQNVYFDTNDKEFDKEAIKTLDRFYRFWKEFPELNIKINVHTDSKALENKSIEITDQFAEKAMEYLVGRGVDQAKIELKSWGKRFIMNGCGDNSDCLEHEHRMNRRIELIFVL